VAPPRKLRTQRPTGGQPSRSEPRDGRRGEAQRQQKEEARRRKRLRRQLLWIGGTLGLVVALGIVVYSLVARAVADMPGEFVPSLGNQHINSPDEPHIPYNSDPPTSGPHLPYLAPWGVHEQPIPRELQVHNLEDGGVLVQYNCPEGCPELVEQLKAIVQRYPQFVILAPYEGMDARIALTAWTRIDKFDEFDEARIVRFIEAYRGIDHHR